MSLAKSSVATQAPAGRRAGLIFIAATVCLDVVSQSITFPILPKLTGQLLGGDPAAAARWVGILEAAWAIAQFFAAPVLGMFSDRFGRRPVIVLSVFGVGAEFVVCALAPNVTWLLIGRILCGLTCGAQAAAMAYVADVTAPEQRTNSYSWLNASAWTGVILGPALGGLLAAWGLRVPFWAAAGFAFANGVYGFLVLPESLAPENRAPLRWSKANACGALRLLVERQGLFVLGLILLLLWLAGYALNSLFVLYTAYRYGWSPLNLGVFLSVVAAANILIQTGVASRTARLIGEKGAMVAGLGLQVVGFTLVGLAPSSLLFWFANLPVALGNIAGPALQSLMTAKVEADEQGRLQGAMGAVGSLTGFVAPVAFTQLFAWAIGLGQGPGWSGLPILIGAAFSLVAWGLAAAAVRSDN